MSMPGLSWAAFYAFIQARVNEPVEKVVLRVDRGKGDVKMWVNKLPATNAPVTEEEISPLAAGYEAQLPTGSVVKYGTLEVDFIANKATTTLYYEHNGREEYREFVDRFGGATAPDAGN